MSAQSNWGNIPNWAYESVRTLLECLKSVDPATYEHCLRVGEYSRKLSRDMGMNEYQQKISEFAGMLHDIGKIGIDREILLKPGRLEPIEYDIMKSHSILSENIIRPLTTHPFFAQILPAVRGHHERIDGEGYPDKKMGDEIQLIARVILTVDTFDAMGEDRPYRKGLPEEIIFAELKRCAGTQFDSDIVKVFLQGQPHWKKDYEKETLNNIIKKIA
jgi:putative nucleotidyltransferase with HDIG domain